MFDPFLRLFFHVFKRSVWKKNCLLREWASSSPNAKSLCMKNSSKLWRWSGKEIKWEIEIKIGQRVREEVMKVLREVLEGGVQSVRTQSVNQFFCFIGGIPRVANYFAIWHLWCTNETVTQAWHVQCTCILVCQLWLLFDLLVAAAFATRPIWSSRCINCGKQIFIWFYLQRLVHYLARY